MIRILVVDDHPAVIAGVRAICAQTSDLEIAASATSLRDARRALASDGRIDVVVGDLWLGDERGLDLLADPGCPPFLAYSAHPMPRDGGRAAGYVAKTSDPSVLVTAIRAVAAGLSVTSASAAGGRRPPSPQELAVISGVATGKSNSEIADQLGISDHTVETHLRRVFDRYEAANRAALVAIAIRNGWIEP